MKEVKVGDTIYVDTCLYLSHGIDDFIGGQATVIEVGDDIGMHPYVRIAERPSWRYNWQVLAEKQEEFKERYGDQTAHPQPDYDPKFNRWD